MKKTHIKVYVTEEEKKEVQEKAEKLNQSDSSYLFLLHKLTKDKKIEIKI